MDFLSVDPVNVDVSNLSFSVDTSPTFSFNKSKKTKIEILKNVSFSAKSGKILAILGASGSGKTSLLNIVAKRFNGRYEGSITYNNSSKTVSSAYVLQEDILLPSLTVRETLEYAARLRLPYPSKHLVENVLLELGLKECANTIIGDENKRGISGGEKRRTSIGVQLLANPSILFLDEPTTGLDAFSAYQLVLTLQKLAQGGRTIVTTIHQPRSDIFFLFDEVMLLAKGEVLYNGPSESDIMLPYFINTGIVKAPSQHSNPADYLIDISAIDLRSQEQEIESRQRVEALKNAWKSFNGVFKRDESYSSKSNVDTKHEYLSPKKSFIRSNSNTERHLRKMKSMNSAKFSMHSHTDAFGKRFVTAGTQTGQTETEIEEEEVANILDEESFIDDHGAYHISRRTMFTQTEVEKQNSDSSGIIKVGGMKQIYYLTKRTGTNILRDTPTSIGLILEGLIVGTITGWIFYKLKGDLAGIRALQGAQYTTVGLQGYLILLIQIYNLGQIDVKVFDRERSEGLYNAALFSISNRIAYFPVDFLNVILYSASVYYMTGYRSGADHFFIYFLINMLVYWCACTFALVCVSVDRSFAQASLYANSAYTFLSICSGFFIQADQIPVYVRWIKYLSFVYWSFKAVALNEYSGNFYDCPSSDDPADPNCQAYTGKYILQQLSFAEEGPGETIGILAANAAIFFLLGTLILHIYPVHLRVSKVRGGGSDESIQKVAQIATSKQNQKVDIGIHQIGLHVKSAVTKKKSNILDRVDAEFKSGQLNVILGPSGSGKSTLLNLIAQRINNSLLVRFDFAGQIRLNGENANETTLKSICSYVLQDDSSLLPALTVRETLQFSALLRLPKWISKQEKFARAEEVLMKMGLKDCADTIIGSEWLKGISGGERRRVTIGVQILTEPKVLLLDEPTSGLDAFIAYSLFNTLKELASEGRTIICSIHQSRLDLFNLFDNILLLARGGSVLYSDKADKMLQHFQDCGYTCPTYSNPTDFVLDIGSVDLQSEKKEKKSRERVDELIRRYRIYQEKELEELEERKISNGQIELPAQLGSFVRKPSPLRISFPVLVRRSVLNFSRNPGAVLARLLQVLAFAIILTLFYSPIRDDYYSIFNRLGLIQQITPLLFVGMLNNIAVYPSERDVFYKEYADSAYTSESFFLSYTLLELPFEVVSSLLFGLLINYVTGLQKGSDKYFIYSFAAFACVNVGESLGIAFNSIFNHTAFAVNLMSTILSVFTIMAGILSFNMPAFLNGLNYISPVKYAAGVIVVTEFRGLNFTCNAGQQLPDGGCPISTGDQALDIFNLQINRRNYLLALAASIVIYRFVAYLCLKLRLAKWSIYKR